MIIILPNDVDGDDRVDGRDDGGRRYFSTYFPSFPSYFSLSLIFLFFFPSFFFFVSKFQKNLHEIRI